MLPVYEAIGFNSIIHEKAGRTKPWTVWIDTKIGGTKLFAVKVFKPDIIQRRNSVECEVLANVLAQEFDLQVPQAALIDFSPQFIMNLPAEAQEALELADPRLKFGSEWIEPPNPFYPDLSKGIMQNYLELDTLLAFDNLIRNRDRHPTKPNLILSNGTAYLIDHELGFERIDGAVNDFAINEWSANFVQYHICTPYLKRAKKATKQSYFETFREYMKYLNVNKLDSHFAQLTKYGFVCREKEIKDYLELIHQNSDKFVTLLTGHL